MGQADDRAKAPSGADIWWNAAEGERQAVRVDSRATDGAYAVVESVADDGCGVPRHLHRNEDEHLLVLSGRYRFLIGGRIVDASAGDRVTVPRNTSHSWRNMAARESRPLAVITPGGFEQLVYHVKDTPADEIVDLAAQFGCDILAHPLSRIRRSAAPASP